MVPTFQKSDLQENLNEESYEATILNDRLKGKFFIKIFVYLSKRKLSESKIHFCNPVQLVIL